MKQKKLLKIALTLFLAMTAINSFGQIYNADFSNDGDGFADHTTAIPPAIGTYLILNPKSAQASSPEAPGEGF